MIASVEVPRAMVERARKHFKKTGRPLLLRDRRRRNDWELVALPANRGYLLAVGPETPPGQLYGAMKKKYPHRDLVADLCGAVVTGIEGLPQRFSCEGLVVGMWEIEETLTEGGPVKCACVRGPVALSCLSWTLRARKVGFYLVLQEVEPD